MLIDFIHINILEIFMDAERVHVWSMETCQKSLPHFHCYLYYTVTEHTLGYVNAWVSVCVFSENRHKIIKK